MIKCSIHVSKQWIHRNEKNSCNENSSQWKGKIHRINAFDYFSKNFSLFWRKFQAKIKSFDKLDVKNAIKILERGIFLFQGSEIQEMTTFQRNLGFFWRKISLKLSYFFIANSLLHRNDFWIFIASSQWMKSAMILQV